MVMCVALLSLFSDRLMELSFDRIILFCNELDKARTTSSWKGLPSSFLVYHFACTLGRAKV